VRKTMLAFLLLDEDTHEAIYEVVVKALYGDVRGLEQKMKRMKD